MHLGSMLHRTMGGGAVCKLVEWSQCEVTECKFPLLMNFRKHNCKYAYTATYPYLLILLQQFPFYMGRQTKSLRPLLPSYYLSLPALSSLFDVVQYQAEPSCSLQSHDSLAIRNCKNTTHIINVGEYLHEVKQKLENK